ncbi:hypothetical protein [Streptomyces sp. NPDC057460]|uniref:hypothetical protein n=1 Tax=Streptomyces sp. NPDC057460 TaxID=3346141 RepID=UPI003683B058
MTRARDVLGRILSALAPRPQAEPGRRIARLDAQLLRRPPADPRAPGHLWRRDGVEMRLNDGVVDPPRRLREDRRRVRPRDDPPVDRRVAGD